MSVRYSRPMRGRPSLQKTTSSKRKVQQAWDSSVQDLNVHRATPEELARRHEIHKSKNQRLAHWELQKKSLTKNWRKENGGTPDPLEERRLALMMEILSDHYQMKDVLERSDRAMAVVKDLFGDAPHRHAGFPNVTMAPSCDLESSRGPIMQRKDPPTRLSILSESVMDSQALNEVDDGQSEYSDDDDVDVSISFQPGLNTDRIHQLLHEERSHPSSRQMSKAADVENSFVTPKNAGQPPDGQSALNATAAVKKVKTRLTAEELDEPQDPKCVIGRVLNPNPQDHRRLQRKGKKKRSSHAGHRPESSLSAAPACELSCNQSSLDVLNQMIQDVERELEEYERQTGRQVDAVPRAQGLTGFTLSLVSAIRRLVSYLREGDRRLRQEAEERQRLQEELHEQRLLIDALTAEILSMKESCSLSPFSCQSATDPCSPPEVLRSLPSSRPEQKKPTAISVSSQVLSFMGLQDVEETLELVAPPCDRPGERTIDGSSLLGFQPAIMLSPPRQRSREEIEEQRSLLRRSLDTLTNSVTPRAGAKDPPASCSSRISSEPCSAQQRLKLPSNQGSSATNSVSMGSSQSYHPSPEDSHVDPADQEVVSGDCRRTSPCKESIAAHMAELTLQNNTLKVQLRELSQKMLGDPSGLAGVADGRGLPQAKIPTPGHTSVTLEQRIAELNRQSAEARNKLLNLIEQQKQSASISPAISPITPQCEETERRGHVEAVIPMPRFTDSLTEETPSPQSRSSGRRSGAPNRSGSTVSSSLRAGVRASIGKQNEEEKVHYPISAGQASAIALKLSGCPYNGAVPTNISSFTSVEKNKGSAVHAAFHQKVLAIRTVVTSKAAGWLSLHNAFSGALLADMAAVGERNLQK